MEFWEAAGARGGVCDSMDHFIAKTVKAPPSKPLASPPFLHASTTKMSDKSRYAICGAFILGVALTAAYNNRKAYLGEENDDPDPEWQLRQQEKLISRFAKIKDLDTFEKSSVELELDRKARHVKEGIEGCIGDTPLIKIKSLSEYTGCEILAKAEVI